MPPTTLISVHQPASRKARWRFASAIGTSITSGGIGKKELSAKAIAPRYQIAWGPAAWRMTQS